MQQYAMVHGGYVVNVVMWDGTNDEVRPPPGVQMVVIGDKFCGPGFKYNAGDGSFEPAPVMLPGTNYDKT
jgi:prepilin-type processing-associated H-X9-DG protein